MKAIIQAVNQYKPKLLFIANPNNPDGSVINLELIEKLLALPLLLVIDEAYIDFSEISSADRLVRANTNLIVIRTFSKWAGLAGLRIGYGIYPDHLAPAFLKAKQPYNVSMAALVAARVTLSNREKAQRRVERIIQNREFLYQQLQQVSWLTPLPSQANFILTRVKEISAVQVAEKLRAQGILIRYFTKPNLRDYIRISIGTRKQMVKTLEALESVR